MLKSFVYVIICHIWSARLQDYLPLLGKKREKRI